MRTSIAAFVAMAGTAACAGERITPTVASLAPQVHDSAGVEIVVNAQEERALTLRRVLHVGVVDGNVDIQFDEIRAIAVDSAGSFWVVDRNPSIRHYDADGRYLGGVGAAGRGPGEAQGYASVTIADGRVLAWGYPMILQLFERDGTFIDSRVPHSAGGSMVPLTGPSGSSAPTGIPNPPCAQLHTIWAGCATTGAANGSSPASMTSSPPPARGTVGVPGTFEPMAVTADRVYGVAYDAMGVEFIVAYELAAAAVPASNPEVNPRSQSPKSIPEVNPRSQSPKSIPDSNPRF